MNTKTRFRWVWLGLCLTLPWRPGAGPAVGAGPPGTEDPVAHCEHLSLEQTTAYMDALGKARRFDALIAIYKSGTVSASPYAAYVHAKYLDDDAAVALCTSFEYGTGNWQDAVSALAEHRRTAVIGYFKQAAESSNPVVRAVCYVVCDEAGWDDLMDMAKADQGCPFPLVAGRWQPGDTVGRIAAHYVKHFTPR